MYFDLSGRQLLNAKLPLWYQVAQSLRSDIMSRSPDNLRLPTEPELAAQYGVSIITVRQALKSIEEEGLISRHRRRGTFINPVALPQRTLKLLGSLDAVFVQQASEITDVLERKLVSVPPQFEPQFGVGVKVMMFRRLRRDGGQPVSYALNYVRADIGEQIQRKLLRRTPMTKVLRDELGIRIRRIEDTVEAQLATPEVATLLQMELMTPILYFTGTTFNERNEVVDIACISYRGDRYKFSVGFDVD